MVYEKILLKFWTNTTEILVNTTEISVNTTEILDQSNSDTTNPC